MKKIEELSQKLQAIIGFVKPSVDEDNDINGDKVRMEDLQEKMHCDASILRNKHFA